MRTWLYPALKVELVGTVIYPMLFQCFNLPLGDLILVQIFMCSDATLFSSHQVTRDSSVVMGNGSHASAHSVGTVDLKLTTRKIVQLKNM
jgi:hypothetical protein